MNDAAAVTALLGVHGLGARRLVALLERATPLQVWEEHGGDSASLDEATRRLAAANVAVTWVGRDDYPAPLRFDPARPPALYWRGDLAALAPRRVAIVGTRAASGSGRHFASQLGGALAREGITVVSGLARGIDGAAHRGVFMARDDGGASGVAVAVVASGLDVVYPREHSWLWERVGEEGLLVSESPPGTAPEAHRFPMRNRILAALAEVVVVAESRATGGSMITVAEAIRRDVTVMAVPGSPRDPAAVGANLLLQQGCAPVVGVDDVLTALGLDSRRSHRRTYDPRPPVSDADVRLLAALADGACTLDRLVIATGRDLVDVAVSLGRLESAGRVVGSGGWWEVLDDAWRDGYRDHVA